MSAYNASQKSIPIIVEAQHIVDLSFMFRLMSYCQQLYLQRKIVPVVLVFVVSQIKHEVMVNCKTSSHHAFLLKYRKETWAESCYLADYKSVESSLQNIPMHPLVGLSFFLTGKCRSLAINSLRSDSTIQKLYRIAKEIFENNITECDNLDEFLGLCQRTNDQIEQGLTLLRSNTFDNNKKKTQMELSLMGAFSVLTKFHQDHAPASSVVKASPSEVIGVVSQQLNQEPQAQSSAEGNQWAVTKNCIESHKSSANNGREPIPCEDILVRFPMPAL